MAPKTIAKKRNAAPPAVEVASPPTRRRLEKAAAKGAPSSVIKQCGTIASVLVDAHALSDSVRGTLCSGTPWGLEVAKGKRHPYQTRVIAMVGSALAAAEADLRARLAEAEENVARADAEHAAGIKKRGTAEAKVNDCSEAIIAAKVALTAITGDCKESEKEIASAQVEQRLVNDELAEAASEKELLKSLVRNTVPAIRNRSVGSPALEKALSTLPPRLRRLLPSMLPETPSDALGDIDDATAAGKDDAPASRLTFDETSLSRLEEEIVREIAESRETVSFIVAKRTRVVERVQSWMAERLAREEKHHSCQNHLDRSQVEQCESQAALTDTTKTAKQLALKSTMSIRARNDAETRLADFLKGPLRTFRELEGSETPNEASLPPATPATTVQREILVKSAATLAQADHDQKDVVRRRRNSWLPRKLLSINAANVMKEALRGHGLQGDAKTEENEVTDRTAAEVELEEEVRGKREGSLMGCGGQVHQKLDETNVEEALPQRDAMAAQGGCDDVLLSREWSPTQVGNASADVDMESESCEEESMAVVRNKHTMCDHRFGPAVDTERTISVDIKNLPTPGRCRLSATHACID